jgi:hypothetical protein
MPSQWQPKNLFDAKVTILTINNAGIANVLRLCLVFKQLFTLTPRKPHHVSGLPDLFNG